MSLFYEPTSLLSSFFSFLPHIPLPLSDVILRNLFRRLRHGLRHVHLVRMFTWGCAKAVPLFPAPLEGTEYVAVVRTPTNPPKVREHVLLYTC